MYPVHRRKRIMCTCCQSQNFRNNSCGSGYGSCRQSGCNGCGQNYCNRVWSTQCGAVATSTSFSNGCSRYIGFPVSGTAYVPTSAIYFCPSTTSSQNGTTSNNNGSSSSCGCNCCGFGRCGGAAAIANYYEDYYARQYGLNN